MVILPLEAKYEISNYLKKKQPFRQGKVPQCGGLEECHYNPYFLLNRNFFRPNSKLQFGSAIVTGQSIHFFTVHSGNYDS
jgi:hypothetical protein